MFKNQKEWLSHRRLPKQYLFMILPFNGQAESAHFHMHLNSEGDTRKAPTWRLEIHISCCRATIIFFYCFCGHQELKYPFFTLHNMIFMELKGLIENGLVKHPVSYRWVYQQMHVMSNFFVITKRAIRKWILKFIHLIKETYVKVFLKLFRYILQRWVT